jgi:hypothetical protein
VQRSALQRSSPLNFDRKKRIAFAAKQRKNISHAYFWAPLADEKR